MDKVPIPEQDVIPHENVAPNVYGLRVMIVNVYAIRGEGGNWMLVDCGLPYSESWIRRWTDEHFGKDSRASAIFLTHGHFDHTGVVEDLAREWSVPVYAHPLEMPYLTGEREYPAPDPSVGGGLMALMSRLYPRGPVNLGSRVHALPSDGSVPDFSDWQWLHTPGHSEGHVSLFRESDRTLIAGDAFVTTKQESLLAAMTQRPELHGPPAYYTTDWDAARESVRKLAALRPKAVGTGHGHPITGDDVADTLDVLARDFDRIARPEHGMYVDRPAA